MRAKGLVISHRMIWFGIPLLCLSLLLCGQTFRLMFWTQRRDRHAEALEFPGSDIDVKLVERLTPTTIRLVMFVPPGRCVEVMPVTTTSEMRERAPVTSARIETSNGPGYAQLTYNLNWDPQRPTGLLYGSWQKLRGATISQGSGRHVVRVTDEAPGWRIDPGLDRRLVAESESEFFLPVFVSDSGQRIGLEFRDATEPK